MPNLLLIHTCLKARLNSAPHNLTQMLGELRTRRSCSSQFAGHKILYWDFLFFQPVGQQDSNKWPLTKISSASHITAIPRSNMPSFFYLFKSHFTPTVSSLSVITRCVKTALLFPPRCCEIFQTKTSASTRRTGQPADLCRGLAWLRHFGLIAEGRRRRHSNPSVTVLWPRFWVKKKKTRDNNNKMRQDSKRRSGLHQENLI